MIVYVWRRKVTMIPRKEMNAKTLCGIPNLGTLNIYDLLETVTNMRI
jgi:hypothetical protein